MISAELATRVAEAYDVWSGARHKADLQALAACVEDALKEDG